MLRSLFIMGHDGVVVIEKHWRGVTKRSVCDEFWSKVLESDNLQAVPPVMTIDSDNRYVFVSVYRGNLFFLGIVENEVPPIGVIELLLRIVKVLRIYLNNKMNETTLKSNFTTVYHVVEEMLDNGFPMITEPNILMQMIEPPSNAKKVLNIFTGKSTIKSHLSTGATSQIYWRGSHVMHNSNEIWFDLEEKINAVLDNAGGVVSMNPTARVHCKCKLSGKPNVQIQFSHPDFITDPGFHPCVRHAEYDKSRTISFIPPDGLFELMEFNLPKWSGPAFQAPIFVRPAIHVPENSLDGRINISVAARRAHSLKSARGADEEVTVNAVVITIPYSDMMTFTNMHVNAGQIVHEPLKKKYTWRMLRLPTGSSPKLSGKVNMKKELPVKNGVSYSVDVKFRCEDAELTHLKIKDVQVTNASYRVQKCVRNIVFSGQFTARA